MRWAVAAFLLIATPAMAADLDVQVERCTSDDAHADLRLGACTWTINSGLLGDPALSMVFASRGRAYSEKGDDARAIADLSRAIDVLRGDGPGTKWLRIEIADGREGFVHGPLLKDGETAALDSALDDLNQAAALAEKSAFAEAVPHYESAIASGALDEKMRGDAHAQLGFALSMLRRHGEALDHYLQAAEIFPDNVHVLTQTCYGFYATANIEEALRYCDRALEKDPDAFRAIGYRALLLRAKGDFDAAISEIRRAIALAPTEYSLKYNLAQTYDQAGRTEDSRAVLAELFENGPDWLATHARTKALFEKYGFTR